MGYEKFLLKTIIISIAEIWPNNKNHTKHQYYVFFESRNNKSMVSASKNTLFASSLFIHKINKKKLSKVSKTS